MATTLILIVATVGLCLLYVLTIGVRAYMKSRGVRLVTCPETQKTAAVEVDAPHMAVTAAIDSAELRLRECSRWPERRDCGQECLQQIEQAPEGCLVRTILAKWYAGKSCVLCGKPFGPVHSWDHPPGFIAANGEALRWSDVPSERLPEVLVTHQPICWTCEVTEEFRRRFPDRVVDDQVSSRGTPHS